MSISTLRGNSFRNEEPTEQGLSRVTQEVRGKAQNRSKVQNSKAAHVNHEAENMSWWEEVTTVERDESWTVSRKYREIRTQKEEEDGEREEEWREAKDTDMVIA